jgi:hypothetical protein
MMNPVQTQQVAEVLMKFTGLLGDAPLPSLDCHTDPASIQFTAVVSAADAERLRQSSAAHEDCPDIAILGEDLDVMPELGSLTFEPVLACRGHLIRDPSDGLVFCVGEVRVQVQSAAAKDCNTPEGHALRFLHHLHTTERICRAVITSSPQAFGQETTAASHVLARYSRSLWNQTMGLVSMRHEAWARRQELVRLPTEGAALLASPVYGGKHGRAAAERELRERLEVTQPSVKTMTCRLVSKYTDAHGLRLKTSDMSRVPFAIQPQLWASKVADGEWFGALCAELAGQFRGYHLRAWLAWLVVAAESPDGIDVARMASGSRSRSLSRVRALLGAETMNLSQKQGDIIKEVLAAMGSMYLHVERERGSDEMVPLLVTTAYLAERGEGGVEPGAPSRIDLNPVFRESYKAGRGIHLAQIALQVEDDIALHIAVAVAMHHSHDAGRRRSEKLVKWLERWGLLGWFEGTVKERGQQAAMDVLASKIQSLTAVGDGRGGLLDLAGATSIRWHVQDWRRSMVEWGEAPLVLTVQRKAAPLPLTSAAQSVSEPAQVS